MTRFSKTLFLLGAAYLVTGCATTAKGISQSTMSADVMAQSLRKEAPAGSVLAVVRYPAYVDSAAAEAYYKAFGRAAIGGDVSSYDADSAEVRAIADSIVLKSNYFALSLFKELAAKLPEHSVLLSPHTIKLGADGKLTSEPMTQAESLPNVVSVDFSTYTFPDAEKMMDKQPLTFGDLFTPLVTVHTHYLASTDTQGLRLASRPILNRAARNGRDVVNKSLESLQNGQIKPAIRELDFVAHLKGDRPLSVETSGLTYGPNTGAVQSYPLEKIALNRDLVAGLADDSQGPQSDPLKSAFTNGFANQIIGIINGTDVQKATAAGKAAAISQFDESLAALTFVGSEEADYTSRLRYAERLLEAEQKYLSVQSLRLFDGVHNGEIGAQVRDMIVAEHEVLEKRRDLARQQNQATALAILGAVAAGGVIASGSGGSNCSNARTEQEYYYCRRSAQRSNAGRSVAVNALINGAIYAGQRAYAKSRLSKAYGENYISSIIPALDEQTTVTVDLIDSNETITAVRFEDLSTKLQTLYNEAQRSLETVATRCAYSHDGVVKSGTWLGVCESGLANGSGVGVIRNTDGTDIEYYGYAQNGRPHGAGYLIVHTETGSRSLEGHFTNGQPDGIMRETRPGEGPQLRSYSAGQDTGPAPRGSYVPSPFKTGPAVQKTAALWTD